MSDRKPDDVLSPNPEWWAWSNDGWECAAEGNVRDAHKVTRGQAAGFFATETIGHFPNVRVWKRYAVALTRQDSWDNEGRDRAIDDYCFDHNCEYDEAKKNVPEVVPSSYDPDESAPVWEIVHKSHPRAIPIWICGVKGDTPPRNPKKRARR